MKRHTHVAAAFVLTLLTACGSYDEDGSAATGPLGQPLLMTDGVQAVTRLALDACIAQRTGASLAALQSQGFRPWRGGYLRNVPNPNIAFNGSSRVAAKADNGVCTVETWPTFPVELETMRRLTGEALAATNAPIGTRLFSGGSRGVAGTEFR